MKESPLHIILVHVAEYRPCSPAKNRSDASRDVSAFHQI